VRRSTSPARWCGDAAGRMTRAEVQPHDALLFGGPDAGVPSLGCRNTAGPRRSSTRLPLERPTEARRPPPPPRGIEHRPCPCAMLLIQGRLSGLCAWVRLEPGLHVFALSVGGNERCVMYPAHWAATVFHGWFCGGRWALEILRGIGAFDGRSSEVPVRNGADEPCVGSSPMSVPRAGHIEV